MMRNRIITVGIVSLLLVGSVVGLVNFWSKNASIQTIYPHGMDSYWTFDKRSRSSSTYNPTLVYTTTENYIRSLTVFNGYLYATTEEQGSSTAGKVYRSADGTSWSVAKDFGYRVYSSAAFNGYLYVGLSDNQGIWRSSDGINYIQVHTGLTNYIALKPIENYLYAGGYINRIERSLDGVSWDTVHNSGNIQEFAELNGKIFAPSWNPQDALYSSSDGTTWGIDSNYPGSTAVDAFSSNNGIIWVAALDKLYKSTDGGNWSQVTVPVSGGLGVGHNEIVELNSETYFPFGTSIYKTINGSSWTLIAEESSWGDIDSMTVFNNNIYFGTSGQNNGKIYRLKAEAKEMYAQYPGEGLGSSIKTGDFNGDGYYDIIVGAPSNDIDGPLTGRAYILYGSISGIDNSMVLELPAQSSGEHFGHSVASGDFNNDGFDDALIGATGNDEGGNDIGRAYIFWGDTVAKMDSNADGNYDSSLLDLSGQDPGEFFGTSVNAGDFNGDGYDDAVIGAGANDVNAIYNGAVYVFYGSSLMNSILDWNFYGSTDEQVGADVTLGDFNGDSYDDILTGSHTYNSYDGKASILFGGSSPDNIPDIVIPNEVNGEGFGYRVGAGDTNNDGFDEALIQAYRSDEGMGYETGRVYLYYGDSLMDNIVDLDLPAQYNQEAYGSDIATGDINNDEFEDIIIGAPVNDFGGTAIGRTYIYFGGTLMDNSVDIEIPGHIAGERFGIAVAIGDFNDDSYDDVAVGAYAYNSNDGHVYFYDAKDYLTENIVALWHFDEGSSQVAIDSSGNGNDGQLGSTTGIDANDPTWVNGISGKALEFDSSDDYVIIPNNNSLNLVNEFTLEAWIKPYSLTHDMNIIIKGDNTNHNYVFYTRNNGAGKHDELAFTFVGFNGEFVSEGVNLKENSWYYVVAVYSDVEDYKKIYVNGGLVFETEETGEPSINANSVYIGNSEHASQYYFDGIIDEVRIWNKALSTKEIQAHYEEYEKNKIPVADAGSDILVEVGQVFSLDASGSYDLDGYIIEYYWDFNVEEDSDGDGIKDNDHDREGVNVSWKYTKTGVNIITLIVIDDQLATSKDTLKVIVKTTISIFNPLEDGFSFDNPGWTLACFDLSFEEAKTILMSDEFHHYLDEGSTSALKYWFIYLFAKVSHRYGHCYGMSALAMNYYKDYLPTPGGSTSYELSYNQISSDIEYYHNWQVLNVSTFAMLESWGAEGSPINDENQWGLIKTTIESGEPIIIGLQSDRGRHAVIGYAFDENGDVLIYDPSDPATEQNPTNYIDITELNSDITIQYQWDDGTTFNSWIALSYEQANVIEWYFDQLKNSLWFKADCPIELTVYDHSGNKVGESLSDGETHLIIILEPTNENYTVKLAGTGEGMYNLTLVKTFNNETIFQNTTNTIRTGEIKEYIASVNDVNIELQEIEKPKRKDERLNEINYLIYIILIIVIVLILIILVIIISINRRKYEAEKKIIDKKGVHRLSRKSEIKKKKKKPLKKKKEKIETPKSKKKDKLKQRENKQLKRSKEKKDIDTIDWEEEKEIDEDALKILKKRLAKGEIDIETYRKLKKELE